MFPEAEEFAMTNKEKARNEEKEKAGEKLAITRQGSLNSQGSRPYYLLCFRMMYPWMVRMIKVKLERRFL